EHPHLAGLGIDLGAEPDEVVVGLRMLLLPGGLVRRGHRLLETLEDRVEGDALLALQLTQRSDHLRIHRRAPLSSASQSTTVRADAMSANSIRRPAPSTSRSMPSSSSPETVPTWRWAPSTGPVVRTSTRAPMHRSYWAGVFSGRSRPGELTSSW